MVTYLIINTCNSDVTIIYNITWYFKNYATYFLGKEKSILQIKNSKKITESLTLRLLQTEVQAKYYPGTCGKSEKGTLETGKYWFLIGSNLQAFHSAWTNDVVNQNY